VRRQRAVSTHAIHVHIARREESVVDRGPERLQARDEIAVDLSRLIPEAARQREFVWMMSAKRKTKGDIVELVRSPRQLREKFRVWLKEDEARRY
jgi:hypothetical protein